MFYFQKGGFKEHTFVSVLIVCRAKERGAARTDVKTSIGAREAKKHEVCMVANKKVLISKMSLMNPSDPVARPRVRWRLQHSNGGI